MKSQEGVLKKTGTTTVGLLTSEAVILGAEKKATMGYLVASKRTKKILQIDERMGMTIAGLEGDAQALARYMQAELKLYRLKEEKPPTVRAAAVLLANILYSRRFFPYLVQLLVGGYDTKPRLYSFDPSGALQEETDYFSTGSGSPIALGVLEDRYRPDLSLEEAKRLVVKAIDAATKRDIASGGSGIDVVVIDKKGYRELDPKEIEKLRK